MRTAAVASILVSGLLQACSQSSADKRFDVLAGDRHQRIEAESKALASYAAIPSAILDAHWLQEKLSDGFLGPSDYVTFVHIQVAPDDVAKWTSRLSAISEPVTYAAPKEMQNWWVSSQVFSHLAFYRPAASLSDTAHGWIGVSPSDGHIFVFSYTM